MKNKKPQLIVALDVDSLKEAMDIMDSLDDTVEIYKIGNQLFTACGPVVVRHVLARNKKVFLDLKFHDIPNTVTKAIKSAVGLGRAVHEVVDENKKTVDVQIGISMMTVHTCGGAEMLKAAVRAAHEESKKCECSKPLIVGVTVLTSEKKEDNIRDIVLQRARLAKDCGLDGVVASAGEANIIRQEMGHDFIIVTPGIRPTGADQQDQKRVVTPKEAVQNGSNFLVVGRPIVQAKEPKQAALQILTEINLI